MRPRTFFRFFIRCSALTQSTSTHTHALTCSAAPLPRLSTLLRPLPFRFIIFLSLSFSCRFNFAAREAETFASPLEENRKILQCCCSRAARTFRFVSFGANFKAQIRWRIELHQSCSWISTFASIHLTKQPATTPPLLTVTPR